MTDENKKTEEEVIEEPLQEGEAAMDETSHIEEPAIEEPGTEVPKDDSVEEPAQEDPAVENRDEPISEPETPVTETPATEAETISTETETAISDEENASDQAETEESATDQPVEAPEPVVEDKGRWYVVHTFSGHENRVAATLKQRIDSEHLENLIFDILVPTQDKIEIRGGKKETVKEKIFPGYILVKMHLTDESWLAVRTTQGVTSFVGAGNKPTPISNAEVNSIVKFTSQGAQPTFKEVFMVDDTVKIIDGPFADFIGKVDSVDTEKGRVRVLVSIFGRETPVELDFLQVTKL